MVKVAKDSGDGRFLWPKGCETIEEVPDELLRVIEHAQNVLSWHENLMSEDIPPKWMWHLPDQLDLHFKMVEDKRGKKDGGSDDGGVPLDRNELIDQDRWSRE